MGLLDGKVILVVGGGSGIGRAGAVLAGAEGATVVVADLDFAAAQAAAAAAGPAAGAAVVDVRDSASVQAMVARCLADHGRIDGLFHTAMSVPLVNREDRRITELPEAVWDAIIGLGLTGAFLVTKHVARAMQRQASGAIVLTATVDALIGQAGLDAYTAAKGGVVAMTRSVAAGLAGDGIRVNAICPGFVDTPHQRAFLDRPEDRARIEALHLLPVASAAEVAELAVFLLSERARAMTGGVHVVDGGYTAFKGGLDLTGVFGRDEDPSR